MNGPHGSDIVSSLTSMVRQGSPLIDIDQPEAPVKQTALGSSLGSESFSSAIMCYSRPSEFAGRLLGGRGHKHADDIGRPPVPTNMAGTSRTPFHNLCSNAADIDTKPYQPEEGSSRWVAGLKLLKV